MKNILSILLVIAVMGMGARAEAQQPARTARIAYFSASLSCLAGAQRMDSLKARLASPRVC